MTAEVLVDGGFSWLPRVVIGGQEPRLVFLGGADALRDAREFSVPIREAHLDVLRTDRGRHLLLLSALGPICAAAGIGGELDEAAASALLDPILLGSDEETDEFLRDRALEQQLLIAHGADLAALEQGRMVEAMQGATERADWQRAQEATAERRRAERGVVLAPLDAAILRFTGQYVHGSTLPRRLPSAVDPELLPAVLGVIEAAERASAGLRIARDPRRGKYGADQEDWRRMKDEIEAALRAEHPDLVEDAVRSVCFLLCSEASTRARSEPFDMEAPNGRTGQAAARPLAFTDDSCDSAEDEETWTPEAQESAANAFWGFVSRRIGSGNHGFVIEDEANGEALKFFFDADAVARVSPEESGSGTGTEFRAEYALFEGLAHARELVRGFVADGSRGLDGLARWTADMDEFEAARKLRAAERRSSL